MQLARKLGLTLAGVVLVAAVVGVMAPAAQAADSSWGCGGQCRPTPKAP